MENALLKLHFLKKSIVGPSSIEFVNHLKIGGNIKYGGLYFVNSPSNKKLSCATEPPEFIYSIKDDNSFVVKRVKFDRVVTISFKLEFVELI